MTLCFHVVILNKRRRRRRRRRSENESADGILLIDADNAFNRINRAEALWNIQFTCPIFKFTIINVYRKPSRIIMIGSDEVFELLSREGTTQGCPFAMAFYALSLIPLTSKLHTLCQQVWFADDGTGCDTFDRLRNWFDTLLAIGPKYGYFPKPTKCILITKPDRREHAERVFRGTGVSIDVQGGKDTGVEINSEGTRHLGAAIGTNSFREKYIKLKVEGWTSNLTLLSKIATTQPHAAFAAFTHFLQGRWTFISRSMPEASLLFQPLEHLIRTLFLPSLFGRDVTDMERDLISLPARYGGLGISNPVHECKHTLDASLRISKPLVELIMKQESKFEPMELAKAQRVVRAQIEKESDERHQQRLKQLETNAPPVMKLATKLATEKGASSWVTAMPSNEHSTVLHKGDFRDACAIRYGWQLRDLPHECGCGEAFSVQHALDCPLGGYRTMQHDTVKNLLAECMREGGVKGVEVEPQLQPLSGETFKYRTANKEDDARSDIKCFGFWTNSRFAFFDVKVVSPFAKSYSSLSTKQLFRQSEKAKNREYRERILNVEHGDFTPLVFTTSGGMAPQSQIVTKRIAQRLSEKKNVSLSVVSGWLRCRISFALLRTTLLCVRGSHIKRHPNAQHTDIEFAVHEAQISY